MSYCALNLKKKVIDNNLGKSVKIRFFNKKYTITICVGRVWNLIGYFLIEKHGLLHVIGIQKLLLLY